MWIVPGEKEQAAIDKRIAKRCVGFSEEDLELVRLNHAEDVYREAVTVEGWKQKRWKGRCGTCGHFRPIDVRFQFNKCNNCCRKSRKR